MSEIKFDFKGIINLLAKNLYSEKKVFIRELVQNAHDAIRRRQAKEQSSGGRIDIYCRPEDDRIIFKDTGIGMSREDLDSYLSSLGASGTRESHIEGVIGQFGIGFMSAFIVAKKVEVFTRKLGESQGWLWTNEGDQSYTLEPHEVPEIGTTVDVTLAEIGDCGLIRDEFVKDMIRQYCDLLLVPIHVGASEFPVNTMRMPWERDGVDAEERAFDCRLYLEKNMRDSVLETIPVNLRENGLEAHGVLYISSARMYAVEPPRTVRVFQKRMFLCESAIDLLPKWASFVNGVIDTPSLVPTAARDNFQRDETFGSLRDTLGQVIIGHLEMLKSKDPARLSQILAYHNMSIKAACDYYDEFFDKFAHLLEWKVNSGDKTQRGHLGELPFRRVPLSDILSLLPTRPDAPKRLSAFSTTNSANQYFDMANANATVVVDASHIWDAKILERLARRPGSGFEVLFIDREEDPAVFRELGEHEFHVRRLAEVMAQIIHPGGARLRVDARHFQPDDLVAVIRASELSKGQQRARKMMDDPNVSASMREMAEEMMHLARSESMRLTINAGNPFIQQLALQDPQQLEVQNLMMGAYNNAILYNQELMTPDNARIFHDQFAALLQRSLAYLEERATLKAEREQLDKERQKRETARGRQRSAHPVIFLMTPFADAYRLLEDALRRVVEDRWGCQLFLARDHHYDNHLLENVRQHMDRADVFLAEVSEQNPNVMFELGAVLHGDNDKPVILLCSQPENDVKPLLPADLRAFLYLNYPAEEDKEKLAEWLEGELKKNDKLQKLKDGGREHFLSTRRLRGIASGINLDEKQAETLVARFPTLQRWAGVTASEVAKLTGLRPKIAEALIEEVLVSANLV
jgi:molecular chaperone HtpG